MFKNSKSLRFIVSIGVFKKTNQPIKQQKPKKINWKNRTDRKNWLKIKKPPGSGLKKLKPIEPDQTEPV
jgi:hypothetical protein